METTLVDYMGGWKKFLEAFDKIFTEGGTNIVPVKDLKNKAVNIEVWYPSLTLFKFVREHILNEIPTPPSDTGVASGKTSTFFLIKDNDGNNTGDGLKIMPNEGLFFQTVANNEYQSIKVEKTEAIHDKKEYFNAIYKGYMKPEHYYIDIGSSPFYNQTYIHIILDKILNHDELYPLNKQFIKQNFAGINKKNEGITGLKLSNRGSLHSYLLKKFNERADMGAIVIDALSNLYEVLQYLKCDRFLFNHNDLKAKNVFVHEENNKVYYQIADYDKSAISYKGYRFRYHNKTILDKLVHSGYKKLDYYSKEVYIMDEQNYGVIDLERNAQFAMLSAFYYKSYDFYTLTVSVLLSPAVLLMCFNEYGVCRVPLLEDLMAKMFNKTSDLAHFKNVITTTRGKLNPLKLETALTPDYTSITAIANLISKYELFIDPKFLSVFDITKLEDLNEIFTKSSKYKTKTIQLAMNNSYLPGGNFHICASKCDKGLCACNKYTMRSSIYDQGSC